LADDYCERALAVKAAALGGRAWPPRAAAARGAGARLLCYEP
jgi:hypothetical protein